MQRPLTLLSLIPFLFLSIGRLCLLHYWTTCRCCQPFLSIRLQREICKWVLAMPVAMRRLSSAAKGWYRMLFVLLNTPLALAATPPVSDSEEEPEYEMPDMHLDGCTWCPDSPGHSAPPGATCLGATCGPPERYRGVSRMVKADLIAEASKCDPDVAALQRMTCVRLRALIREARALSGAPGAAPRRGDAGSASAAPATPEPSRAPRSPADAPDGIERAVPPACVCNQRAMVLRKNRAQEGNLAWFWGCASYPVCKQTFQYVVPV